MPGVMGQIQCMETLLECGGPAPAACVGPQPNPSTCEARLSSFRALASGDGNPELASNVQVPVAQQTAASLASLPAVQQPQHEDSSMHAEQVSASCMQGSRPAAQPDSLTHICPQPSLPSCTSSTTVGARMPMPLPLPSDMQPRRYKSTARPPASVTAGLCGALIPHSQAISWSHINTDKRSQRRRRSGSQLAALQSTWKHHFSNDQAGYVSGSEHRQPSRTRSRSSSPDSHTDDDLQGKPRHMLAEQDSRQNDLLLLLATAAETSLDAGNFTRTRRVIKPARLSPPPPEPPTKRQRHSKAGSDAQPAASTQRPWHVGVSCSAKRPTVSQMLAARQPAPPGSTTPPVSARSSSTTAPPPLPQKLKHAASKGTDASLRELTCSTPTASSAGQLPVARSLLEQLAGDVKAIVWDTAASMSDQGQLSGGGGGSGLVMGMDAGQGVPVWAGLKPGSGDKAEEQAVPRVPAPVYVTANKPGGVWLSAASKASVSASLKARKSETAAAPPNAAPPTEQQAADNTAAPNTLDTGNWPQQPITEVTAAGAGCQAAPPATTCDNNSAHCVVTRAVQPEGVATQATGYVPMMVKSNLRPPMSQMLLARSTITQ